MLTRAEVERYLEVFHGARRRRGERLINAAELAAALLAAWDALEAARLLLDEIDSRFYEEEFDPTAQIRTLMRTLVDMLPPRGAPQSR